MITLIIARHGNTFGPNDTPTRVGARTDLPLVQSGIAQAHAIGRYLKKHSLIPDMIYSGTLQRAMQTAEFTLRELALPNLTITSQLIFNEIDYGPDENKTEKEVIARIGQQAIDAWNTQAKAPNGWNVNPDELIQNWLNFSRQLEIQAEGKTVLVITSNGIARFAPHIAGNFSDFCNLQPIKLSTGALTVFTFSKNTWKISEWNLRPT